MEEGKLYTGWCTKYALTLGVFEVTGKAISSSHDQTWYISEPHGARRLFLRVDKEWFSTEAEAIAKAETMRTAKIASLKKQVARLEKLSFGEGKEGGDRR